MNSRTSFFNKSLIRSDLRRLWWISALHTIGIFLFYTFLYLDQYTGEYGYLPTGVYTDFGTSPIYRMSPAFYVLAILVPVGLSAFLFSYLQNNSSMTCLHGIPVSRKTHYFSHLLSGGIMLLIPVLVNGLILLLFRMNKNVAESYRIVDLFWLLASGLVYEILSFTAASLVMTVVGNAFAGFCLTFAIAALPAVAESFIFYFCEQQLYGYVYNGNYSLVQFLYAAVIGLFLAFVLEKTGKLSMAVLGHIAANLATPPICIAHVPTQPEHPDFGKLPNSNATQPDQNHNHRRNP